MDINLAKVTVVKMGGATLGSHDTTIDDLVDLQQRGRKLVVVHGGGKMVTKWCSRQGVPTMFAHGERVTDEATLEMVTAVLCGLINKEFVAAINNRRGRAVGISGADGSLIQGRITGKEMGFTGTVEKVDVALLIALLHSGYIPVIAPVSLYSFGKPKKAPELLNINGDLVAGEIAAAICADRIIFLTDVDGIHDYSGELICNLSPDEAEELVASGVVSGGMIPKIKACLCALSDNLSACTIVNGKQPHALLQEMEKGGGGTTIGLLR
ncbi:acetylglutamate kinase [Chloroflexota bacterium]